MHNDLREWIADVEKFGEIKHISGFDSNLEMGAVSEITARIMPEPVPALMFENIPGYDSSFRTLFGLLGSMRRVAKTLGLSEDEINRMNLLHQWREKMQQIKPLDPVYVNNPAVCENVETGADIDLLKFPVPLFHEHDGGRYFGTCHGVIQMDPDSGWVNVGTYRSMLVDKNHVALHILEGQHGSIIMNNKYFAHNKKMPVAIGVGLDPTLWFSSFNTGVPMGISEYAYTGGIKGEPVKVFKGEYTGLPLPADAEIVIEGECRVDDLVNEGPFGEWHGYYGNLGLQSVPEPNMEVKAVYYRNNPIFTCQLPTIPCFDLSNLPIAIGNSEGLWKRLENAGIPGIKGVWVHSEIAGDALFVVVSIEQQYPGHARETGLIASQYPRQGRYTIVVEEDVDPSDIKQVIWAIATRGKPHEAIAILNQCRSSSADPTIPLEEKLKYTVAPKPLVNSRVIIDACRPLTWKKDWYPMARMSEELSDRILRKMKDASII